MSLNTLLYLADFQWKWSFPVSRFLKLLSVRTPAPVPVEQNQFHDRRQPPTRYWVASAWHLQRVYLMQRVLLCWLLQATSGGLNGWLIMVIQRPILFLPLHAQIACVCCQKVTQNLSILVLIRSLPNKGPTAAMRGDRSKIGWESAYVNWAWRTAWRNLERLLSAAVCASGV